MWFQQKREDSLKRKQEEEMRRQMEIANMIEKKDKVIQALEKWKAQDQQKLALKMAKMKEKTLKKSIQ